MDIVDFNPAQELELLSREENHFFDFKRSDILPGKLEKTFVALANADGGEIYIGVDNDDQLIPALRIHGFKKPEAANNHVAIPEVLLEPRLLGVTFSFARLPSKPSELILCAVIPKSDKVHYTSGKECFKRSGAQNLPVKGKDIESLIFSKGQSSYEDTFVDTVAVADLAKSEYLKQYLQLVPTAQPADTFLRKQRLVEPVPENSKRGKKSRVRCAAVLLFDDEPQSAISTRCGVKVTRFKSASSKYDRSKLESIPFSIEGPTDLLIRRSVAKIQEIMASSYFWVNRRYRRLRYPITAIHEIIANAVLHRDYSLKDDVHISIYDNRIEVTSPGRLPGHITPANILNERFMRNPKIVRLVNKLPDPPNKDIGEGLNTAFREMEQARLKPPTIEELEAAVKVTLLHEPIASPDQQIVDYLKTHRRIKNKQGREVTGKESEQGVFKIFRRLIASGIIELVDENANVFNREYQLTSDWEEKWEQRISEGAGNT